MTAEEAAAAVKQALSPSMGRHVFAVVGSYPALEKVDTCLAQLGCGPSVPVTFTLLGAVAPEMLERLQRFEDAMANKLRQELQQAYEKLLRERLAQGNVLVLRDFELLVQVGMDMQVARNFGVNGKNIVLLVPGGVHEGQIYAYPDEQSDGRPFYPGFIEAEHVWQIE